MKDDNQPQKIERIILDPDSVSKIKVISDQITKELGDLVQVTQKSVANFIIQKRSQLLSTQEMSEFLSENYDLVKALKHATQEAIKAKHNGTSIEINEVLKLIQTPSVSSESVPHNKHGRKKNADLSTATKNNKGVELRQSNEKTKPSNSDPNSAQPDTNSKQSNSSVEANST